MSNLFGERMQAAREAMGLGRNIFAMEVNMLSRGTDHEARYNESNVYKWEAGKGWPRAQNLGTIAAVLGVTIDYLYGRTDDPQGFDAAPYGKLER